MLNSELRSDSLEIVALWENAVCLHTYQKSLIPADLIRAKKRLAQLSSPGRARHSTDQPFLFYRMCVILARRDGSATMGELGEALGVPLSTATRLVNRLARGRFVERQTDSRDRRIIHIALTAEGNRLYHAIHDFAQQRIEVALSHFTAQERRQLIKLLRKTIIALADLSS